jgi:hypothetical protein
MTILYLLVCYPGGNTYFRPHHDSGRLSEDGSQVQLNRDEHGAARIATVFVYLSTHSADEGGATRFNRLGGGGGVKVQPKAGSAAVWSNVDKAGAPDVDVVHEAESLSSARMVSMGEALQDRRIPLKMGLNLWFTDVPNYPRPEVLVSANSETAHEKMHIYAAHDIH